MIVLSLFDGLSCGRIALQRAGIQVTKYFASEIDKHAITVTKSNWPDTIHIGDVKNVRYENGVLFCETGKYNVGVIDLICGGSPCQSFSFAGKQLNFIDPRSQLFFEYARIKNEVQPTYFLFENVLMKQQWLDVITQNLNVPPVLINSRLVSAQDRKRLYWSNISFTQPTDKNISWIDISDDGGFAGAMRGRRLNANGKRQDNNKSLPQIQYIESRMDDKTNCLTTVMKDTVVTPQKYQRVIASEISYRYCSRKEMEKLQTLPLNYTETVSVNHARKLIGNGWTVDVISHIFSFIK